ncbi:MAG: Fe-S cluster assembly protein IscX [Pseudomonadota bacterium]|nr:Fe-S cluster assembly protein IscX [Pseudomonadota bacterium]
MSLHWEGYTEIARALDTLYPSHDRVHMSRDDLRKLVVALPDFSDSPEPDDPELFDAILYAWIGLHNENDERWDPS